MMAAIEDILCGEQRGVLSLIGAGGKTSLMFQLARLLVQAGKRVLTTTTTKIFMPSPEQCGAVLVDADPAAILRQSLPYSHVTAAAEVIAATGKLQGFPVPDIAAFADSGLFDWVMVEADGAARRPLKAPAAHEPVIPATTTVLVAVVGLDVLGKPFSGDSVFRSELAAGIMGLAAGATVTEATIARLLAHPLGSFKKAPCHARRFIFLNQADDAGRRHAAGRIAGLLRRSVDPVAEAVIVGQALDGIRIHGVYPLTVQR